MKIINFIRRLIALPFSMVGIILLLAALIVALPFILIGRVIGPSDGQVSSADSISTLIKLLDNFSKDDDGDGDDDGDASGDPRIAFQVKRLDKAFF